MSSETNEQTTAPEERARRAEAALEDALRERNELWAQLQQRVAREREVEALQQTIERMEGSLSWRLTAPLRLVKRLGGPAGVLRAIRRRLRGR